MISLQVVLFSILYYLSSHTTLALLQLHNDPRYSTIVADVQAVIVQLLHCCAFCEGLLFQWL